MDDQGSDYRLVAITKTNRRDVDIVVRDGYGKEHILWPQETKEITVIRESDKQESDP
jgi:hypothetical protein